MSDLAESARFTKLHVMLWRPILRSVAWFLLQLMGPFRSSGSYRVPKNGGVLILANHLSDVDPIVLQVACPRPSHFMGKTELFEMRFLGRLLKWGGAFPVKRGEPDRAALRLAADYLKLGEVVCIFPEGQISETGELQEIKPGVALIMRMAQVPVICLGIKNTNQVMPYSKMTPRFARHRASSRWGDPKLFSREDSSEVIVRWITEQLTTLSG